MKLVFAIINSDEEHQVIDALMTNNFRATKIKTTGGFLREGNVTLMCAIEDHRVQPFLQIISEQCHCRTKLVRLDGDKVSADDGSNAEKTLVDIGGATVLVLNVERYLKM